MPDFEARQHVYLDLPLAEVAEPTSTRSWAPATASVCSPTGATSTINQLWIKQRADAETPSIRAKPYLRRPPAAERMHPIAGLDAVNCTEQMGIPGPAYDRLPHFAIGSMPASGAELQVEYFVPLDARRRGHEDLRGLGRAPAAGS